eukprot:10817669-Ditylum_brightwellii.AAC.1
MSVGGAGMGGPGSGAGTQHCTYGSMTRRPWRVKQSLNTHHNILPAYHPGQCVSIDQMESTTPGVVAQLKGRFTIK